jgi:hypothetical protein
MQHTSQRCNNIKLIAMARQPRRSQHKTNLTRRLNFHNRHHTSWSQHLPDLPPTRFNWLESVWKAPHWLRAILRFEKLAEITGSCPSERNHHRRIILPSSRTHIISNAVWSWRVFSIDWKCNVLNLRILPMLCWIYGYGELKMYTDIRYGYTMFNCSNDKV